MLVHQCPWSARPNPSILNIVMYVWSWKVWKGVKNMHHTSYIHPHEHYVNELWSIYNIHYLFFIKQRVNKKTQHFQTFTKQYRHTTRTQSIRKNKSLQSRFYLLSCFGSRLLWLFLLSLFFFLRWPILLVLFRLPALWNVSLFVAATVRWIGFH